MVIGNAHIERKWRIQNGLLTATSFRDLDAGIEWLGKPADRPGPMPAGKIINEPRTVSIAAHGGRLGPVEAESLVVEMTAAGLQTFHYQFQIFPEARGITIQFDGSGGPAESNGAVQKEPVKVPTGFEQAAKSAKQPDEGDALEDLLVAPQHFRLTQVTFFDQTDIHNELVCEREWMYMNNESDILARGNIIFGEDVLTGAGLIFFKQAPLPDSRPIKRDWDVRVSALSNRIRFAGQGYPFVVLAYSGGRNGRIQALQRYQRQIRAYDPRRDGMFLSNTWGDRSRDARINEEFMLKEITAGARLGVDASAIESRLRWLTEPCPFAARVSEGIIKMEQLADGLMRETHRLAWELHPAVLDDLGLEAALRRYLTEWSEQSLVTVDFHSSGLETARLALELETALYRVTQEALTNVLRHAKAQRVSVLLERRADHVSLIVEDDGVGFEPDAVLLGAGTCDKLGLLGMQERIRLAGGTLDLESTPERGTTVFVRAPLETKIAAEPGAPALRSDTAKGGPASGMARLETHVPLKKK